MNKLYRVSKTLLIILLLIIGFAASAFGMYEYNNYKAFNKLASEGKQYMIQKDYDKAMQAFRQALNYKKDAEIQSNLALVENLKNENAKNTTISKNIQLAADAAKNNKYDEANKYLDEVLKTDPDNSEAKSLKDSYVKAIQAQQEKAKYESKEANIQNQQKRRNMDSNQDGVTEKQAYQMVCNKFKDCDVFVPKRSDYSDGIAEQAGDKYYLFYTEYKSDHSASDNIIGVHKKTGGIYALYGDHIESLN